MIHKDSSPDAESGRPVLARAAIELVGQGLRHREGIGGKMGAKTKLFDFTEGHQGYITLSDDGGFLITVAREGSELSKGFDNLAAAATELAQGQLAEVERLRALLRLATAPLQALLDLQAEVVQCRVCKGGVALCLPHASTLWHIVNVGRTILADTDEALKDAEGSAAERS